MRVRLADFARVDSLTLGSGESQVAAALVDAAGGFGYFGVGGSQGGIVKVRLADFARVATLATSAAAAGGLDPAAGLAYFAGASSLVSVRLADFVISDTLSAPGYAIQSLALHPAGGYAYLGADRSPGWTSAVLQVRVPALEQAGTLALQRGEESFPLSAVADPASGYAYFGTYGADGYSYVVKVDLPGFTRVDSVELLPDDGDSPRTAVIDPARGYAYFGLRNRIVRIRLADFTRSDHLTFPPNAYGSPSAAIDVEGGFAYFALDGYQQPAQIIKLRLTDFSIVASLMLDSSETAVESAAIDPVAGYAYFGVNPRKIIKVRLSDFTRVGTLTLRDTRITMVTSAAIDVPAGYGYFAAGPGVGLVRVRLADFVEDGSVAVPFYIPRSLLLDPLGGYAYVLEGYQIGAVAEIRLSDLALVHIVSLADVPAAAYSGVIDPAARRAYVGSNWLGVGALWSFRLPDTTPTPTPSATHSPTATATATATTTAPPSATATPSATPTALPTVTATPPASATATQPVTPQATATATDTPPAMRPRLYLPLLRYDLP